MIHLEVQALLAEDAGIRMIHKHWPVFGERSVYASRAALAARWHKYEPVHDAFMRASGTLDRETVRALAAAAGVDLGRLDADLATRAAEIEKAIADASNQAGLIGLRGTPSFVIGRYLVPGGLDLTALRQIVADVRAPEEAGD